MNGSSRMDQCRRNWGLVWKDVEGASKAAPRDLGVPKLSKYNFNIDIVDLVSALKDIKEGMILKNIHCNPDQRNMDLLFDFCNSHGHFAEDCKDLWIEVSQVLRDEHCSKFSAIEPNTTLIRTEMVKGQCDHYHKSISSIRSSLGKWLEWSLTQPLWRLESLLLYKNV